MTTAALAEKGQVGFCQIDEARVGMRASVLSVYLGLARTARFALIDFQPG